MANVFDQFDQDEEAPPSENVFSQFDPVQEQSAPVEQGFAFTEEEILKRAEILPAVETPTGTAVGVPEFAMPAARAIKGLIEGTLQAEDITGEQILNIGMVFGGMFSGARTLTTRPSTVADPGIVGRVAEKVFPEGPGAKIAKAAGRLNLKVPKVITSDVPGAETASKLGKVPVGGGPLRTAARSTIEQLGVKAEDIGTRLGARDPSIAGEQVRSGVSNTISDVIKGKITEKFDEVAQWIVPGFKQPLTKTIKLADELAKENIGAALPESKAIGLVREAIDRPKGLDFAGLQKLRTSIGELLDNPGLLPADISKGELKRVFGALSEDLKALVTRAGDPEGRGLAAFNRANVFTKRQSKVRKSLNKLLGRDIGDEQIFEKIIRMANKKGGNKKLLGRVRGAVDKETWDEIGSALIERLGRDKDGNFDPTLFSTQFGGMSSAGKKLIFGRTGKGKMLKDLNDIASISSRSSRLTGAASKPSELFFGATGLGAAVGAFTSIPKTAAIIIGVNLFSRMLANPKGAGLLANYARFADRFRLKGTGRALFENSARALAAEAANLAGEPDKAAEIEQRLLKGEL